MFRKGISDFISAGMSIGLLFFIFAIFSTIDIRAEFNFDINSEVVENLDLTLISLLRSSSGDNTLSEILIRNFYEGDYEEFNSIIIENMNKVYEDRGCLWQLQVSHNDEIVNWVKGDPTQLEYPNLIFETVKDFEVPIFGKPGEALILGFLETC